MKAEILRDSVDLFESSETTQTDQESTFCSNLRDFWLPQNQNSQGFEFLRVWWDVLKELRKSEQWLGGRKIRDGVRVAEKRQQMLELNDWVGETAKGSFISASRRINPNVKDRCEEVVKFCSELFKENYVTVNADFTCQTFLSSLIWEKLSCASWWTV